MFKYKTIRNEPETSTLNRYIGNKTLKENKKNYTCSNSVTNKYLHINVIAQTYNPFHE